MAWVSAAEKKNVVCEPAWFLSQQISFGIKSRPPNTTRERSTPATSLAIQDAYQSGKHWLGKRNSQGAVGSQVWYGRGLPSLMS